MENTAERVAAKPTVEPDKGFFSRVYAPSLLVFGAFLGVVLGWTLKGHTVTSDFWKQLGTIAGVATVPVVVLGMRGPAFAAGREWQLESAVGVVAGFSVVTGTLGICLFETAQYTVKDATPATPSTALLLIACAGTGITLAALALGVVLSFFQPTGKPV
jgi:hypothetical protein